MKLVAELMKYPDILEDNIQEIFLQSTYEDHREGQCWYQAAHSFCKELSSKYNVELIKVAGIVSSLSVQKGWDENKRVADLYFQGIYKHTKQQINKCHKILLAKSYAEIINILGGVKTKNFFGNILYPNDKNYVVIDRHMIKVATGVYEHEITPKQYDIIKNSYISVANKVGMTGSQLQSICWLTYRRIKIKRFTNIKNQIPT